MGEGLVMSSDVWRHDAFSSGCGWDPVQHGQAAHGSPPGEQGGDERTGP